MATKTANLYARIEPDVKKQAEEILLTLGIPVSNAINMFYKQIILQRGIPFDVKIPYRHPLDMSKMTEAELDEADEKPKTEPPKLSIAASKLRRVRVLGS